MNSRDRSAATSGGSRVARILDEIEPDEIELLIAELLKQLDATNRPRPNGLADGNFASWDWLFSHARYTTDHRVDARYEALEESFRQ
jgi:hypothetical protein